MVDYWFRGLDFGGSESLLVGYFYISILRLTGGVRSIKHQKTDYSDITDIW